MNTRKLSVTIFVYFLFACSPATSVLSPTLTPLPTATTPVQVVDDVALTYCFAFPEGFTQLAYDSQVQIVGPHEGIGSHPGLMWIDATDAGGRTAEDVANEEVAAFGGSPPRSTVTLGGEQALVLDYMPGQDALRRVYIVHDGQLYILSFSPDSDDYPTAREQMELLYASVTTSWVWKQPGAPCPEAP